MVQRHLDIGVVVARRTLHGPWADHVWAPHAVLPGVPSADPWTSLGGDGMSELFYAGPFELSLHSAATANYRDNLLSERPSLWVSLSRIGGEEFEIGTVTADPYEGEALAEGVGELIEAVPMPEQVQRQIAAFVMAYFVERPFFKRKRDRADPRVRGARRPPSGAERKVHER